MRARRKLAGSLAGERWRCNSRELMAATGGGSPRRKKLIHPMKEKRKKKFELG